MVRLDSFFGLAIDEDRSDVRYLMSLLEIESEINETKVVSTLSKQNGKDAAIVTVAQRQQILKMIAPTLNQEMLEYDANFYQKEINTSSQHDRRYNSEDRLLEYALLIASAKSKKMLDEEPAILNEKQLREAAFTGTRFDRCWDILSQESEHIVSAFRKSKK